MLVLRPFRGLREKLFRYVWPSLVGNSTSVKLSRPFPSSAAPRSRSFALRETFVRRFYIYWRFLDDWRDCFPWRSELHVTVSLFSDASTRAWGAVLFRDGRKLMSRDYWPSDRSFCRCQFVGDETFVECSCFL